MIRSNFDDRETFVEWGCVICDVDFIGRVEVWFIWKTSRRVGKRSRLRSFVRSLSEIDVRAGQVLVKRFVAKVVASVA